MSYRESLEAAGATVHEFQEFGSYQGDWYALVTYNGTEGLVHGSFGSCPGCDAFEGEFGYYKEETPEKLKQFGESYLNDLITVDEAIASHKDSIEWDLEAKEMINWLFKVKNKEFNEKLEKVLT